MNYLVRVSSALKKYVNDVTLIKSYITQTKPNLLNFINNEIPNH